MDPIPLTSAKDLALVDTCFFIDELMKHKSMDLDNLAMTTFNMEELNLIIRRTGLKHEVKKWFRNNDLLLVSVPVRPGFKDEEEEFVRKADPEILRLVRDPSDGVLLAAAILTSSAILTKDKHHLFTTILSNYISEHYSRVRVFKELKDYVGWRNCFK